MISAFCSHPQKLEVDAELGAGHPALLCDELFRGLNSPMISYMRRISTCAPSMLEESELFGAGDSVLGHRLVNAR